MLCLIVLILGFRIGCKYCFGDHGTANSVSNLQSIYRRGGVALAAIYTNSVIQKFPFDGRIDWNLSLFRNTSLSISGAIDTNRIPEYVRAHPTINFLWKGKSKDGFEAMGSGEGTDVNGVVGSEKIPNITEVKWHNVGFILNQPVGEYTVIVVGDFDLISRLGKVSSYLSEYLNKQ